MSVSGPGAGGATVAIGESSFNARAVSPIAFRLDGEFREDAHQNRRVVLKRSSSRETGTRATVSREIASPDPGSL